MPLDGRALIFVIQPGTSLAGSVAVVSKLALTAAMELLLPLKAGVADEVSQATKDKSSQLSPGRKSTSDPDQSFPAGPHLLQGRTN